MLTPQKSIPLQQLTDNDSASVQENTHKKDFEDLLDIAAAIAGTQAAYITLRDEEKLWVTAKDGITFDLPAFTNNFCALVLSSHKQVVVSDTQSDLRFIHHKYVTGQPYIRFYAGFPLVSKLGELIGVLSVVDVKPKKLSLHQLNCLQSLCGQILRVLELRKKNELLELLNERVENKNNRLDKLLQHQEKVMAILGHDTRGPLVFMKEMLQMIKDNNISEAEAQELFGIMDNQIGSTLSLIDNLTTWGIASIGENTSKKEPADLHDIVEKAFQPYKLATSKKGISFCNEIKSGRFKTKHKETLSFIIRNLLNNAVKYTEAGSITVRGRKKNDYYEICVTDTGIGIPKKMLEYLFITKFDSRAGTRGEQGSGLGLMLIFDFVQQLNGYITAESKEGAGTVFKVGIPNGK